jgi:hypothetical protein
MAAKLSAFFVTLLINIVAGVALFFFMLLAMNGYSESDATYGLGFYIVLAVLVSLVMSTGAWFAVQLMIKRKFHGAVAALIAIPVFSVIGAGLKVMLSIIGVLISEYVRVNW